MRYLMGQIRRLLPRRPNPPPLRIFAESHPGHCPEHVPVVRLACICVLLENTNASLMRNLSPMSKFLVLRGMSLGLPVFKGTACNGRNKVWGQGGKVNGC